MFYRRRARNLSLFLIALIAVGATAYGQSLAELAKKEKERRAQTQTKFRVLSNSDVAKFQAGSVTTGTFVEEVPKTANPEAGAAEPAKEATSGNPPAATAASNPAPAAAAQVPAVAAQVKDEKYWRGRFKELTDGIKAAENRSVLAQLQLNELRNRFYRESDGFFRETIQKDTDLKLKEIDRLDKEIKDAQKQLEDFKKEARQNNVPPGWIR